MANTRAYTDKELADLTSMPKRVTNPGARWANKPKLRPVHSQRIFQADGQQGQEARFSVYQRQNLANASDRGGFLLRHKVPPVRRALFDTGALQRAEP